MLIKKLTNVTLAPIYSALVYLFVFGVIVGAYMYSLLFIGLIILIGHGHSRLNDLYDYISKAIK